MVRILDHPYMTSAVYLGYKAKKQNDQKPKNNGLVHYVSADIFRRGKITGLSCMLMN